MHLHMYACILVNGNTKLSWSYIKHVYSFQEKGA